MLLHCASNCQHSSRWKLIYVKFPAQRAGGETFAFAHKRDTDGVPHEHAHRKREERGDQSMKALSMSSRAVFKRLPVSLEGPAKTQIIKYRAAARRLHDSNMLCHTL